MKPFVDQDYPERVHAEQHAKPRMSLRGIPLAVLLGSIIWILIALAAWRWA